MQIFAAFRTLHEIGGTELNITLNYARIDTGPELAVIQRKGQETAGKTIEMDNLFHVDSF
jgi:hypothetical protein